MERCPSPGQSLDSAGPPPPTPGTGENTPGYPYILINGASKIFKNNWYS